MTMRRGVRFVLDLFGRSSRVPRTRKLLRRASFTCATRTTARTADEEADLFLRTDRPWSLLCEDCSLRRLQLPDQGFELLDAGP
jgi:hypothetical protein